MYTVVGNFEIPLQLLFMTQLGQFCTLQIGIFLQMPAENEWRVQLKIPRTE